MAITCTILYELTDTFGGVANYSWVRNGKIYCKEGEYVTKLAAVRRVKKELGLTGIRCKIDNYGELIAIRPAGQCTAVLSRFTTLSKSKLSKDQ